MSKTETWVQRYPPPIEPGPDGAPVDVTKMFQAVDFGLQFRTEPPYVDRVTTRRVRGGQLTQSWRRYFCRDWSQWP